MFKWMSKGLSGESPMVWDGGVLRVPHLDYPEYPLLSFEGSTFRLSSISIVIF